MKLLHIVLVFGIVATTAIAAGQNKVVKRDDAEKKAIVAIRKLKATLEFDDEKPDKPVSYVNLSKLEITDADLVHLKKFAKLKELYLGNT